jgi:hypothetical protein
VRGARANHAIDHHFGCHNAAEQHLQRKYLRRDDGDDAFQSPVSMPNDPATQAP